MGAGGGKWVKKIINGNQRLSNESAFFLKNTFKGVSSSSCTVHENMTLADMFFYS